ncbi:MAG: hypothetical protein EOO44_03655 [Flavobacterium sp.]|nr:MAG: hypothetical protein EOO44_03655 [Flavobacterium sp.]
MFSFKEIKEIESFVGMKFKNVTNGSLVNSKKFTDDQYIQSSFQGFSIDAIKSESGWSFSFKQGGFREELLPELHEKELKILASEKIKEFLTKVYHSTDTDCYNYPELFAYIMIIENKAKISWRECK